MIKGISKNSGLVMGREILAQIEGQKTQAMDFGLLPGRGLTVLARDSNPYTSLVNTIVRNINKCTCKHG